MTGYELGKLLKLAADVAPAPDVAAAHTEHNNFMQNYLRAQQLQSRGTKHLALGAGAGAGTFGLGRLLSKYNKPLGTAVTGLSAIPVALGAGSFLGHGVGSVYNRLKALLNS